MIEVPKELVAGDKKPADFDLVRSVDKVCFCKFINIIVHNATISYPIIKISCQ